MPTKVINHYQKEYLKISEQEYMVEEKYTVKME